MFLPYPLHAPFLLYINLEAGSGVWLRDIAILLQVRLGSATGYPLLVNREPEHGLRIPFIFNIKVVSPSIYVKCAMNRLRYKPYLNRGARTALLLFKGKLLQNAR